MTKKMWGGRFSESVAADVEAYTASVGYDRLLYKQDITGSKAHAAMLVKAGVLTAEEAQKIREGLDAIGEEIESGKLTWRDDLEDVHMNIENRLTEMLGPLGRKLHTGRSRNDQVNLDFRLYVSSRLRQWRPYLSRLVKVLAQRASQHVHTILPGYTHLQPAQPVSLGHHLLAYAQMFRRDFDRAGDCLARVEVSPLGAAALAGTTYPLDPAMTAAEVGFHSHFANSLDAVSDRDYVLEATFVGSVIMAHLSRLCEEIIIWANPNFGYVSLPDAFATGSSIMPQKKNPDVAELMRGKTGRVYGDLFSLMTMVKGLPLAYNRDMQEDKEPFFDADATVSASVSIMANMMETMIFRPERMAKAVQAGFLNATELADYLVTKGMPFREAHHVTGAVVAHCEKKGVGIEKLPLEELAGFSELIGEDVADVLAYEAAVARRTTPGGTAYGNVEKQIADIDAWLQSLEEDGGSV